MALTRTSGKWRPMNVDDIYIYHNLGQSLVSCKGGDAHYIYIYIYIQKHELSMQSASNKKTERQHIQEASKIDEHLDMDGNTLAGHQYSTTWLLCHFLGIQSINDFSS